MKSALSLVGDGADRCDPRTCLIMESTGVKRFPSSKPGAIEFTPASRQKFEKQEPNNKWCEMAERNAKGQLLPGHPGGPGRPKGSRHKLGEDFLAALLDDFNENGVAAIAAAREQNPSAYLKTIAMIVPKSLEVDMSEPFAETFERFIRGIGVSKRVAGAIEDPSCERRFHRDLISRTDDDDNPTKG